MSYALAILSALVGAVTSLSMLILLVASAPNSSASQWATIKAWMMAVAAVGACGLIAAIWLMAVKRPGYGAGAGIVPAVFCVAAFIIILRSQQ